MASYSVPRPTVPVPDTTGPVAKDNLITLDYLMNSDEPTYTNRFGRVSPTAVGIQQTISDEFNATFQAQFAYKRIGNISDYVGNSLPEADKLNSYQYPDDSGDWYGPLQNQSFPIIIPADPSSDDGWALTSGLTKSEADNVYLSIAIAQSDYLQVDNIASYTDIVYKASDGNSAVENMIESSKVGESCKCEGGSEFIRLSNLAGDLSDFRQTSTTSFVSDYGVNGDGTPEDSGKVSSAISKSSSDGKRVTFDVEGVYMPITFVDGADVYVEVDMTLKGNPSTTPQGVTDTLWNIINCDGFSIKWRQGVIMRSEDHGAYQEFSHAIKIRDGSRNGYVGPHTSDGFDGDGLFLLNVANTTIDNPRALRPGRSGISLISDLTNVTINNPYHLGFNAKSGAINLSAIDFEPNEFGQMSVTINKPTGFGQRQTSVGLNVYLELIERNAVNHGRYNVTINDPDYVEYKKTYQCARSTWNLSTDLSPRGQVSIVRPISTNHTDNAILIESWQRKGGISLNIVDPTIVLTKSADGSESSDSGNVIAITRNQAVWVDDDPIGNISITGIDINDTSGYSHTSYCKVRYGRFPNEITFKDFVNRTISVPVMDYPEHGGSIISESSVSAVNPPKRAFTADTSLPDDSMLFMNTNEGASSTSTLEFTLPLIPIGSTVAVANLVGGSIINVAPPAGTSIGTLPSGSPFEINNSTQVLFFERITAGRWFVK